MGVCDKAGRILIFHKNKANMITKFSGCFGNADINIAELNNKSRGDNAVTMMDVDSAVSEDIIKKLETIDDVYRVRVVK